MAIVSTIIDSSSTPSEDSSLDLPQITEAVREVVKVEINKQSADVAATQFVNVSNWLGDNCKPGALGAHSFKDFSRVLEETVQETSDFNTMLTHMARNPDEAQYILPIYAMGISSQVKLLWIHFAISIEDGDERNLAKYGIVLEKLVASREGLAHALQSATDYVKSTVEKLDAFDMVPETARLQSAIWRKLCGLSGPEKIIAHLAELEKIIERVNSDMANLKDGRDGVFWWKADWKTA
jgi:hypothetical protein